MNLHLSLYFKDCFIIKCDPRGNQTLFLNISCTLILGCKSSRHNWMKIQKQVFSKNFKRWSMSIGTFTLRYWRKICCLEDVFKNFKDQIFKSIFFLEMEQINFIFLFIFYSDFQKCLIMEEKFSFNNFTLYLHKVQISKLPWIQCFQHFKHIMWLWNCFFCITKRQHLQVSIKLTSYFWDAIKDPFQKGSHQPTSNSTLNFIV